MAMSGYCFTSPAHIGPFLEPPRIGPTALFGRSLAQRAQAHVIIGYPERPDEGLPAGTRGWNSAAVFGPGGEVLHNARKTFLYETDKAWAAKGTLPRRMILPS
jgi:protein N-terminal amidase